MCKIARHHELSIVIFIIFIRSIKIIFLLLSSANNAEIEFQKYVIVT